MAETPKEFDRTKTEYIDRRQIRYTWWQKQDGTFTDGVTLKSIIDAMPTADVVPVVRCKRCKNYNTFGCADGFGWCENFNNGVTDEHYCSYGERKGAE